MVAVALDTDNLGKGGQATLAMDDPDGVVVVDSEVR